MADNTTASPVATFVSSIGVNIHSGYLDTAYGLADMSGTDVAKVLSSLVYVGIGSVRDGLPYAYGIPGLMACLVPAFAEAD